MVQSFTVGCQKGPRHRSCHRALRDQREAAVHVRLPGMQQALLQTLPLTDAQSQTYRYRELPKETCAVLQMKYSQNISTKKKTFYKQALDIYLSPVFFLILKFPSIFQ